MLLLVRSADLKLHKKARGDFILPLRSMLRDGHTGKLFQFVEVPAEVSEDIIDSDAANRLKVRTNASFLLYGRIRQSATEDYVLELHGIVSHLPIDSRLSQKLVVEFTELLPGVISDTTKTKRYIQRLWIDPATGKHYKGMHYGFFKCPYTARGACATAGETIAVDPTVIPMNRKHDMYANVSISGVGDRTSEDGGQWVGGYHAVGRL